MRGLRCVPVHESDSTIIDGVAALLSEQWGKSLAARKAMLERSCDGTPLHLAFLTGPESSTEEDCCGGRPSDLRVVGHSVLHSVAGRNHAALVESVVVAPSLRGTGIGRAVMEETQQRASALGFEELFLSTHDKEEFYAHLGFRRCGPVSSLRGFGREKAANDRDIGNLVRALGGDRGDSIEAGSKTPQKQDTECRAERNTGEFSAAKSPTPIEHKSAPNLGATSDAAAGSSEVVVVTGAPAPPPPPPPTLTSTVHKPGSLLATLSFDVVWMKKELRGG